MDLSIIIVSWNVEEKLKNNLKAIFRNSQNINFEVFVVDNNSSDNSAEMVKKDFPQVRLIKNDQNLGFAKANNQAIKRSTGKYILLLNPDMQVHEKTLENMLNWMNNTPQASIASCHLIDQNNITIPHVRKFPTLFDQLAIVLKIPHIFPGILNKYLMHNFDYTKSAQVDSIRGAFFMIRRDVISKIGLLDEQYFIWFEEVDYCKQAIKKGLKVFYAPAATCTDHIGQSFSQLTTIKKQKLFKDSMLKYFKKWHNPLSFYALNSAWVIAIFLVKIFSKNNSQK